uniref:Uncharacterized protein n=1 Tax=Ralstonia solanacearum TaxID=305 RepID=A0A0S4WQ93_RALSL|nr:protein of unknown function [Ralstonia solanacearum]
MLPCRRGARLWRGWEGGRDWSGTGWTVAVPERGHCRCPSSQSVGALHLARIWLGKPGGAATATRAAPSADPPHISTARVGSATLHRIIETARFRLDIVGFAFNHSFIDRAIVLVKGIRSHLDTS